MSKNRILNICWLITILLIVVAAGLNYNNFIKTYSALEIASREFRIILFLLPYVLLVFIDTLIWIVVKKRINAKQ